MNRLAESGVLLDQSQSSKFLVAKDGRDYFGPVTFGAAGPVITVASPVSNRRNQIVSVLTGDVSLKPIQESFASATLGKTGYLYAVDSRGTIIAHTKNIDIGSYARDYPIVNDILSGKIRDGLGKDDIFQSRWGARVIGSGKLLTPFFWGVIAEWPFADAQSVVGSMFAQMVQFSIASLILVFLISSFVAYELIRPIKDLKEGARIIGEGKLDYRLKLRTGDEIEELGHSLNKMAEDLKGIEELRTLRLKAEFLAESLKKEQELSKLKDQFISVASHQLYTPLSVINWTVEALQEKKIPQQKILEGLETINHSREDILNIVNDLLTVSEIGFRYEKTKSQVIGLDNLIEKAIGKLKRKAEAKKLKIDYQKEVGDDKADIAAVPMEKVLENLIDNAITYSNDGGKIAIRLAGDAQNLTFSIKDEGIGIPEAEQKSIFQQFFRAKNAVSKKNVGTGLGLFIVKSIVEGHSGKVWFESKENRGSTFYFTIPRQTPPETR